MKALSPAALLDHNDIMRHLGSEPAVRSDESLIAVARRGDRGAFAVLWKRHARSGMRVARQFTSSVDALRFATHRAGRDAIEKHWPGTPAGLAAVLRLAGLPS